MAEFDEASAKTFGPDGKPVQQFDEASAQTLPPASGVIRRTVGDAAVGLAQGMVTLPQTALGLADAVTGGAVDRAGGVIRAGADKVVNAVGDAITGTTVGRDYGPTGALPSQGMAQTSAALGELYSPESKAATAAAHEKSVEYGKAGEDAYGSAGKVAGEFAGAVVGAAQNPSSLIPLIGQSAPSMVIPMAVTGKVIGAVGERAMAAAIEAGASKEVALAAGRAAATKFAEGKAGIATASIAEGVVGGGQNASQAKSDVMDMPEAKLLELQPYKDLLAQGVSPADARLHLAEAAEARTALVSGALSTAAGPIAGGFEARAGARMAGGELAAHVGPAAGIKAGARNAGAEALQETVQSAGEQVGQNYGMRAVDPSQSLLEGVGEQAGQGALAGGVMGAGTHALTSREPVVPPGPIAGAAQTVGLLPPPGQVAIRSGQSSDAGNPATALEADRNAMEINAARAAKEAELARFASNGVISAAAATAVGSGVTDASHARRQDEIAQTLNPTAPLALPAPVSEQEKLADQRNAEYLSTKVPVSLTEAQRTSFESEGRGHNMIVVPAPSGNGYTTIPRSKLSDRQYKAVENIQRPDQGQLPAPSGEVPNAWVAPAGRTPEAQTYGNIPSPGAREATQEWQADPRARMPVPRQMPIPDAKRAAQIAEQKTQETGREHVVVPHPLSATRFAVAPVPSTFEGTATRVQDSTVSTKSGQTTGVDNGATKEAAPTQRPSEALAGHPANVAGPSEATAGPVAAEGTQAVASQDAEASQAINALMGEAATSQENDRSHPTAGQSDAGNYKKVKIPPALVGGLPVTIENPAGSVRVAKDGSWASVLGDHYGYIRAEGNENAKGNDGDHVDISIGPHSATGKVFVIDQNNTDGSFDEHKVRYGYPSAQAAEAAYRRDYPADHKGFGGITETTVPELKTWLKDGDKSVPFADRASGKAKALDSRHYENQDVAAGFDETGDPDTDPLVKRLTGEPSALITGMLDGKKIDEPIGKKLPARARQIVAAALHDLFRLAPKSMFDKISAIHMQEGEGQGEGTYRWQAQAIAVHRRLLLEITNGDKYAARELRGILIHEAWHAADEGADTFYSSVAPSFAIAGEGENRLPVGGIIKEAFDAYNRNADVASHLDYPFRNLHDTSLPKGMTEPAFSVMLRNEVFAQLGRLYVTNPTLLRRTMPKSYLLFEGIVHAIENDKRGGADSPGRAVQQALRSLGADGLPARNAGRGDRSTDQGSAGIRQAGPGLGQGGRVQPRAEAERQVYEQGQSAKSVEGLDVSTGSRGQATLEDFTTGKVAGLLKKKDWAVLTAENPSARTLPEHLNAKRNDRLKKDLAKLGVTYTEVVGRYGGNDEHSFIVTGITQEQALELRDKYSQDSVLTRNGLEHLDGSRTPATGITEHQIAPADFFTSVPNGAMFAVDLAFEKRTEPTKVPVDLAKSLTTEEMAALGEGKGRISRLLSVMKELTPSKEFEHAALAGTAARGWYKRSREAGEAVYGKDYPRFASLMAALSPQTDVRLNFYNAARVWHAWDKAGRPLDRSKIAKIFNAHLITDAGREDGKSAMTAWTQNGTRSLTALAPESTQLSGPKVESFRRNLMGDAGEVTNDRHMAAFGAVDQALFGGLKVTASPLRTKGPGYIAFSARTRQAAQALTAKTGDTWTPAEIQETVWSFWKALYDLATAKGQTKSALQLLRDGDLTHEMVRRVPDLGSFFNENDYRQISGRAGAGGIRDSGAGDRAAQIEPRAVGETGTIAANPTLERIARRADRLVAQRAEDARVKAEKKAAENRGDAYEGDIATEADDSFDIPGFDAPAKADALDSRGPEPLWYSALQTAITDKAPFAKDGTIHSGQLRMWLGARSKDGTLKAEELKWSGLDEYLAAQQGRVSRADVQAFLDQNGVKVEETQLGDTPISLDDRARELFGKPYDALTNDQMAQARKAQEDALDGDTKFASYQLPGGENYRELLLTLPESGAKQAFNVYEKDGKLYGSTPTRERAERMVREEVPGGRVEKFTPRGSDPNAFRSSHFDQPNVLAHVRFNERTDADGKRVLFIEEIQSDWAQKGRKEGFNPQPEVRNSQGFIVKRADSGIPAAPFVGKTEAWVALAMKRMIRYAVDNGFDRVAWTNGEQQADRYDLSKSVDKLVVGRMGTEGYFVDAYKDGQKLINRSSVEAKELPDIIGKELAERAVNDLATGAAKEKRYSGIDLKVGGEGMRAFYDKIVPNVVNDILKKLGGGRVGEVKVGTGKDNWGIVDATDSGTGQVLDDGYESMADAKAHLDDFDGGVEVRNLKEAGAQPGFDITPEMAPRAGKAQVLFFNGPSVARTVTHGLQDALTTQRSFNLWDRTVGTQLNKALKNPLFKRVYDGVQNFLNDSSQMMMEAADLAPDLLPKLDGWRGAAPSFLGGTKVASKVDLEKVGAAVFDGRVSDHLWTDQELRSRGLDDRQIGIFRQARAAIDRSLTTTVTSEAVKQAKGQLPQAVLDQAKADGNPWVVVDALANITQKTPVQQQVYDQLRIAVAHIEDMKAQGYAPLQRFGQYTVDATLNGDHTFTMHESERAANVFARQLREMGAVGVTQGIMSQEAWKLFQGTSPDTLEIFADALGASGSEVMQKYIKLAVNNKSVLKRMLQAKKVTGFQTDIQRTLAQFITSNARAAAKNYHWGEVLKAANDIPKEMGDVKDEAVKLKDYLEKPQDEAGQIRGLLFIQFLGGSIASALTNATQPVMMTLPWLAQHGGAVKAAAQLAAAARIATGGAISDPVLKAAMERATKEGIVAPHEVAGLYAESIRNFGSNMHVRRALKAWGSLFSVTESFNRRITFVAAFRTAVEQGIADPYTFATQAIAETQGVYNKGNKPNWARGAIGGTLFTFKQYSVAYMELLNRLPLKQKALAAAVLVLAAGLQGLPGIENLDDILDTIMQSLGYSFNSKKAMREWAIRTLGDTAGNILVHGVSAIPGVPLDVQARLGVANLFPGTGIFKPSEPDKSRQVLEFFGPVGSQAKSVMDAVNAAQNGDGQALRRSMYPLAVQNAVKAMDMSQTGFYRNNKGERVIDTDAYDAMTKAVGFQPQKVARQTRITQDIQQDTDLAKGVETNLVAKMARAIFERDPELMQKTRAEWLEWNQTNPSARIMIKPQQVHEKVQAMMLTREIRTIKGAPKELRGGIIQELRG